MRRTPRAVAALATLVAAVVLPVVATRAHAGVGGSDTTGGGAGSGGTQRSVVLDLVSSGDGAPATTVTTAQVSTTSTRASVAQALEPTATIRSATIAAVQRAGLTVTSATAWAVTATGPAATVAAIEQTNPWPALVSEVVDPTEGHFTSHAAQKVSDLAVSYGSAAPSASTPTLTSATPIIATIQLSGWDSSVLTQDAKSIYFDANYDPVASGQYVAVNAGRSDAKTSSDGSGDSEVALDQETLLAAAPELKQRAYFAVNTAAGYAVGLQDIYNDVVAGLPIVALSTSWGTCETDDSTNARNALDAALAKLTAVGVTVFAASGDSGAYDCTDKAGALVTGVDFPASDPHVIGVGATTHSNGAAAPAPDTVWSDGNASTPGGSGGGVSSIFARPSYQSGLPVTGRAVPDIAVDGDPNTGISIVTSDFLLNSNTISGGTSLSAPLATALIADSAAARTAATGVTSGYGDIHAVLYAHPEAFTDVVAVTTDYGESDTGFTQSPAVGYDEASGLGTPKFDVLGTLLGGSTGSTSTALSTTATAPSVTITSWTRPKSSSASATLRYSTSGGTVSVSSFTVRVVSGSKTVFNKTMSGATRSISVTLPAGVAVATVTANSSAGTSKATSSLVAPTDDRAAAKGRGWSSVRDSAAYLGTLSASASAGRKAVFTGTGSAFRVTFRDGPAAGVAKLLIDGRTVATVDTYASKTKENVTTLVRTKKGRHTLTVVVLGRHTAHSHGNTVSLDALSAA